MAVEIPGVLFKSAKRAGEFHRAQVVRCSSCEAEHPVWKNGSLKPPEALQQISEAHGWKWDRRGKHLCPDCKPTSKRGEVIEMNQPRTMTQADKRKIFRAIDEVYDDVNQRYLENTTDQAIATSIGVPRAWVEEIREENFGPVGRNEEMDKVACAIGRLAAKAQEIERKGLSLATEAETVKIEAEAMKEKLNALISAVGPRAK